MLPTGLHLAGGSTRRAARTAQVFWLGIRWNWYEQEHFLWVGHDSALDYPARGHAPLLSGLRLHDCPGPNRPTVHLLLCLPSCGRWVRPAPPARI